METTIVTRTDPWQMGYHEKEHIGYNKLTKGTYCYLIAVTEKLGLNIESI